MAKTYVKTFNRYLSPRWRQGYRLEWFTHVVIYRCWTSPKPVVILD